MGPRKLRGTAARMARQLGPKHVVPALKLTRSQLRRRRGACALCAAPRLACTPTCSLRFTAEESVQRSRVTRPVVSRLHVHVRFFTVHDTAVSTLELDRPTSSQQDPGAGRARLAPPPGLWTAPFLAYIIKVLILYRVRSSSDSRTALDVLRLPTVAGPASGPRPSQLSQRRCGDF